MARRVIAVGLSPEVFETGGRPLWMDMPGNSYISCHCADPTVAGLLWREIKRMMRWAASPNRGPQQLTEWQTIVLESYFIGNADSETAERFGCSRANVTKTKLAGLAKCKRYRPRTRGLLTVMFEVFDPVSMRQYLADLVEES